MPKEKSIEQQFISLLEKVGFSYSTAADDGFSQESCEDIDQKSNNLYQFISQITSSGQNIKTCFKFNDTHKKKLNSVLFYLCKIQYPNYPIINLLVDLGADINFKEDNKANLNHYNSIRIPYNSSSSYGYGVSVFATPLEAILRTLLLSEQITLVSQSIQSTEVDRGKGVRWMLPVFLMLKGADPSTVNLDLFAHGREEITIDWKTYKAKSPYDEKHFLISSGMNDSAAELFFILKNLKNDPVGREDVLKILKEALLKVEVSKDGALNKEFQSDEDNQLITIFRQGDYPKIEKALDSAVASLFLYKKHLLTEKNSEEDYAKSKKVGEEKGVLKQGTEPKTELKIEPKIELIKQQKEEEELKKQQEIDKEEAEKNKKIQKIIAKVDSILNDLSKKIETIGNNFSAAKTEAKTLHIKLEAARDVYIKELAAVLNVPGSAKNLFEAAGRAFKETSKTAITQAMDILDKDLGWGKYLKNLLKSIANAVVYLVTVGNRHEFFPYAKSESSKNADQIGEKLQAHDKDESQNTEEEQHQSTPTPNPKRG